MGDSVGQYGSTNALLSSRKSVTICTLALSDFCTGKALEAHCEGFVFGTSIPPSSAFHSCFSQSYEDKMVYQMGVYDSVD